MTSINPKSYLQYSKKKEIFASLSLTAELPMKIILRRRVCHACIPLFDPKKVCPQQWTIVVGIPGQPFH
jgi:hypothetical protein